MTSGHEQFVGYREAEHPGGLALDDQLVGGQRLDREGWREPRLGAAAAVYPPVRRPPSPIQNNSDLAQGPFRLSGGWFRGGGG